MSVAPVANSADQWRYSEPAPPHPKRWTKDEYNQLTEIGFFSGKRLYLFRGELIEMSPQHHPHAFAVTEIEEELHEIFRRGLGFSTPLGFRYPAPTIVGENESIAPLVRPTALIAVSRFFFKR